MLRSLQARLTYANVISTLALFLALGGGAYAAIDLVGRNDIKSKHIASGEVKRSDLGGDAVNSGKVDNKSLRLKDIVVAKDTRTINPGPLLQNQCQSFAGNFTGGPFSRVRPGDVALVFPISLPSAIIPYGQLTPSGALGPNFAVCNMNHSTVDLDPTQFKIVVLR
jgi:hypothetical protein